MQQCFADQFLTKSIKGVHIQLMPSDCRCTLQGNCANYPQIQVSAARGEQNVSGPGGSRAELSYLDDGLHQLSEIVLIEPKIC